MEKDSSVRMLFSLRILMLSLCVLLSGTHAYSMLSKQTWDFDRDTPGKLAAGFIPALTGSGSKS